MPLVSLLPIFAKAIRWGVLMIKVNICIEIFLTIVV